MHATSDIPSNDDAYEVETGIAICKDYDTEDLVGCMKHIGSVVFAELNWLASPDPASGNLKLRHRGILIGGSLQQLNGRELHARSLIALPPSTVNLASPSPRVCFPAFSNDMSAASLYLYRVWGI